MIGNKVHKLGDTWRCECGEEHLLDGAYLAAHWNITLIHECRACHAKHSVKAGVIWLTKKGKAPRKKSSQS